jgi:hypothetical protein
MEIICQLDATTGRLEKESILLKNASDPNLKEAFRLALCPFTQFFIRKIPEYKVGEESMTLEEGMKALKPLSDRTIRGYDARDYLVDILSQLEISDAVIIKRIIGKNLRCGVSEATVNKIWPGLIPTFPCMLCSPLKPGLKFDFPALVQIKMDGLRFNAIVKGGLVEFRTRNGKTLDLKGCLEREFRIMADGRDQVYDGELLVVDFDENILPRQTGNGILAKGQKDTITLIEACQVRATVWDVIPLADFEKGFCKMPYSERFALVGEPINKCIKLVTSHEVKSMDEAQELYQKYLADGQEGVILKSPSGPWEDKRVKHQIKLKAELECDLKVVGIEKGSGKFEGKMGSLMCESSDGVVKTSVGTGFSDALRCLPDSHWLGKVVAIKYNARITDKKTKQSSLFLPVFVELRIDKDTPDASAQIT